MITLCLVCGNENWEAYFSSKEFPEYTYNRCKNCTFIQLIPLPPQEELNKFYNNLWSEHETDSYGDRFLNKALPNDAEIRKWYGPMFQQWESFLPHHNNKYKLLEIGVGRGNILAAAKSLGWDAVGIDISQDAVQNLKEKYGFDVKQGDFCTLPINELNKVDAVHMNHVLEHLRDPNVAMEQIKKILKPGGLFCFAVPTINDKLFTLTSRVWKWLYKISGRWNGFYPYYWCLFSIGHISCFSIETANRFLIKHGFEVQWEGYSLPRWQRTESWMRHFRTMAITPLFWLTNSGWEIRVIARIKSQT